MELYKHFIETLKQEPNYFDDEGNLKKWVLIQKAQDFDPGLLSIIINDSVLKQAFIKDINGVFVLDHKKLSLFLEQKSYLKDSYTQYSKKIGLVTNGKFLTQKSDIELVWPYKDCMLEGGQTREEEKRDEIFFNQTLAQDEITQLKEPKVLTNGLKYTGKGVERSFTFHRNEKGIITDNLLIKGNNLLTLYSLKQEFAGRVRLIYIDPPFNTDNDSFSYNDSFTRSTWLTFMRDRLQVARELLTNDGNIFIHIDINQNHYLKLLADEVFEEENFVEEIIWAYGSPSGGRAATPKPVNIHDYILHYAKNYTGRKQNRMYVPYSEKYINDWFKYVDDDGRKYQKRQRGTDEDGNAIWTKQYLDESPGVPLSTVWTDIQQVYADPRAYKEGTKADVEVIKEFKGGQKPEKLLRRIIEMASDEGDIVLDFHLGTGTTAATAMKLKRQFIGCEQIEEQIAIQLRRLPHVIGNYTETDDTGNDKYSGFDTSGISKDVAWQGGGEFIFLELKKYNQAFMDEIEDASTPDDIETVYNHILEKSFIDYSIDLKQLNGSFEEFKALPVDEQKKILCSLLDKNQLYVNLSSLDDLEFACTDEEKAMNKDFYGIQ